MGLHTLPSLTRQLAGAGLSLGTPAVAVERGTTPQQRAVYAELGALQGEVAAAGLESPTLIIVGHVVALSPGWARTRAAGVSLEGPSPAAAQELSRGGPAEAARLQPREGRRQQQQPLQRGGEGEGGGMPWGEGLPPAARARFPQRFDYYQ